MFLEKIYIFLWFWHILLAFITLVSFLIWFYRIYYPRVQINFISEHLKVYHFIPLKPNCKIKNKINDFIHFYLGLDGMFLIRLITTNCGTLLAGELTAELWLGFEELIESNSTDFNLNLSLKTGETPFWLNKPKCLLCHNIGSLKCDLNKTEENGLSMTSYPIDLKQIKSSPNELLTKSKSYHHQHQSHPHRHQSITLYPDYKFKSKISKNNNNDENLIQEQISHQLADDIV